MPPPDYSILLRIISTARLFQHDRVESNLLL
jgi:hypothetical protein